MAEGKDESKASPPTVADWIAHAIAETGCRIVYGGHGGAISPIVRSIVRHPQLQWVYARNEHDAATMAAAQAKLTGKLAVVVATSGPGATNLVTGLMESVLDGVPVLCLTATKPTNVVGHFEFQDVNQSQLFTGAGLMFSKDALSSQGVAPLLRDAIAHSILHKTCAHLAVPEDTQQAASPLPLRQHCVYHKLMNPPTATIDGSVIRATAETLVGLHSKERNVIAVGLRALLHQETPREAKLLSDAVLHLAETLRSPVLTRLDAKGLVDESHPLSFGVIGVHGKPGLEAAASLISTADRVICIGMTNEMLLLCNPAGMQVRKLVEIQPTAALLQPRYEPEHQLLGDIVFICSQLQKEVLNLQESMGDKTNGNSVMAVAENEDQVHHEGRLHYRLYQNPSQELHRKLQTEPESIKELLAEGDASWKTMHETDWSNIASTDSQCYKVVRPKADCIGFCHPSTVLYVVSDLRREATADDLTRNATVCVDVGDITLWASLCLALETGSRTLYSESLGTMGYGLNAAVASILSKPSPASAINLVGDGAFQMTLNELSTFQQYKQPGDRLLCIVFDNQNLARVEFGFVGSLGTSVTGPDYVALAKAYGGDGVALTSDENVEAVLRDAVKREGLFLVHVHVDPKVKADMASFKLSKPFF